MATTQEHVAIFWDIENCAPASGSSGQDIVESIRRVALEYGPIHIFRAYLELGECGKVLGGRTKRLRSGLQASGVTLIDCPHNGSKEVADKMLLVDMLTYAIDHPAPATIVLISGDRDFVYAVSILQSRKYRVVAIAPNSIHYSLRNRATVTFPWNGGKVDPMPLIVTLNIGDSDSENNLFSQEVISSPRHSSFSGQCHAKLHERPLPRKLQGTTDSGCSPISPPESGHIGDESLGSEAPANTLMTAHPRYCPPAFQRAPPAVPTVKKDRELSSVIASELVDPTTVETTVLGMCSVQALRDDHHATESLAKRGSPSSRSSTVVHDLSERVKSSRNRILSWRNRVPGSQSTVAGFLGGMSGTNSDDEKTAPKSRLWSRYRNSLASVMLSKAAFSCDSSPELGGLRASAASSLRSVSLDGIPSLGSPILNREDGSAAVEKPLTLGPTSLPPLAVATISPPLSLTDTDVDPIVYVDSANTQMSTHISIESVVAHQNTDSTEQDVTQVVSNSNCIATLPVKSSTTLVDHNSPGTVSIEQFTQKAAIVILPPLKKVTEPVPVHFEVLVDELRKRSVRGVSHVPRSDVAQAIVKQDSSVYSRVGMKTFKEYVSAAVAAQIATVGIGERGEHWIALHPSLNGPAPVLMLPTSPPTTLVAVSPPTVAALALNVALPVVPTNPLNIPKEGGVVSVKPNSHLQYQVLVNELQKLHKKGVPQPLWPTVWQLVLSQSKTVYKDAGVAGFTDYVIGAQKAGLVHSGGSGAAAWLCLVEH